MRLRAEKLGKDNLNYKLSSLKITLSGGDVTAGEKQTYEGSCEASGRSGLLLAANKNGTWAREGQDLGTTAQCLLVILVNRGVLRYCRVLYLPTFESQFVEQF